MTSTARTRSWHRSGSIASTGATICPILMQRLRCFPARRPKSIAYEPTWERACPRLLEISDESRRGVRESAQEVKRIRDMDDWKHDARAQVDADRCLTRAENDDRQGVQCI